METLLKIKPNMSAFHSMEADRPGLFIGRSQFQDEVLHGKHPDLTLYRILERNFTSGRQEWTGFFTEKEV